MLLIYMPVILELGCCCEQITKGLSAVSCVRENTKTRKITHWIKVPSFLIKCFNNRRLFDVNSSSKLSYNAAFSFFFFFTFIMSS